MSSTPTKPVTQPANGLTPEQEQEAEADGQAEAEAWNRHREQQRRPFTSNQ
jgi:hypothetical protein